MLAEPVYSPLFTDVIGNYLRLGTHFSCDPVTVLSAIYTYAMKTYPHQMTFTHSE